MALAPTHSQIYENGLTSSEAQQRQKQYGLNLIHKKNTNFFSLFIRQFTGNPLIVVLATATCISFLLGQRISSYYIFGIIIASVLLGLWNEYSAERVVDNLLKKISPTALVIRDGEKKEIPIKELTIGDLVLISQGSIIPADLQLIETKNLEINESALTGESKPVQKSSDQTFQLSSWLALPGEADKRSWGQDLSSPHHFSKNSVQTKTTTGFMGTSVDSGWGRGVVIRIGKDTEYGKIAKSTTYLKPVTEFQKGLASFGNLIIKVIVILTIGMFLINAFLGHSILQSLLFALAIAVGLTPELLPVIVTVSLSHGAGKLAKKHVVAKRLISIENLGNMDILCTDKTGTLTEGKIEVVDFIDAENKKNPDILKYALVANSAIVHHKVVGDSIDTSLWEYALKHDIHPSASIPISPLSFPRKRESIQSMATTSSNHFKKVDEEPFDFNKKAMFTVISDGKQSTLIVKGAPDSVLSFCDTKSHKQTLHKKFNDLNQDGYRVIVVASKKISEKKEYSWDDAKGLNYQGYITFLDIPKKTAKEAITRLHTLNVNTKIITGDNEIVTKKICSEVGIESGEIMLGTEIEKLSDGELEKKIQTSTVFARVTPDQKLKIIQTLQKLGHTVGYMGDGINDIPSLHSADVGISVNTAIDVAKDAASVVLLQKSLHVIADGIIEGRRTFNNTIKYILMSTSSNFGNMFSAAGASFFLPFLPMTPVQILLTNGLYDISQLSIPSDNVDAESLVKPRHWNVSFIKDYMIFFGPLSSIFDFATFGIMIFLFHARGALFQTGWFIESIATEILVVFVIRTARTPFFISKPSLFLGTLSIGIVGVGLFLPFTPFSHSLGLVVPPPFYFAVLTILIILYLTLVELVKNIFLKKYHL